MSAESSVQRLSPQATRPHLVLLDKDNSPDSPSDKILAINKLYVAGFITDKELEHAQQASTLIRNLQGGELPQSPTKKDIRQNSNTQLFQTVRNAGYAFIELSGRAQALTDGSERKIAEEFLDDYRKKAVVALFKNGTGQPEDLAQAPSHNLQEMVQDGQEALSVLTEKHSGLAIKIAGTIMLPTYVEREDYVAVANAALMEAIVRYDPSQGSFSTYATTIIKGRVIDERRKQDVLSRNTRIKVQKINNAEDLLLQEEGRMPTSEAIEKATGIEQKAIDEIRATAFRTSTSLEAFLENRKTEPAQPDSDPLDKLLQHEYIDEVNRMLKDAISTLSSREQQVIALYYMNSLTMKEISERLGVSETRICQIHAKTIKKIKDRIDHPPQKMDSDKEAPTVSQETKSPNTKEEEKKAVYSAREQQFLDLYKNADTVSKSQIMSILREHMDRPPTSQDVQNFLQTIKKKLRGEEKELVNLTPRHSGEPIYRLVPLGSSDFLKPIRQSAAIPRIRSVDEEPDFDDLPEIDEPLTLPSFSPDETDYFEPREITLFDRRSRLPKKEPKREYTPTVVYRKTVAPNGREMHLRPQEFIIYTSVMAGKSQKEIIDESFDGDESKFFNYFSGVATELNALGYNVTPVLHHNDNEEIQTTYDITPKIKQEKEFKKESPTVKYITLTDADIENIVNPPVENRSLTAADVRVLAALMKVSTGMSIPVDRLARLVNPNKISGFSEEVASLPLRVEFYNRVVFKDDPIRIRPKSGEEGDPGGYYIFLYSALDPDQKIELLTRRVEQMEKAPKKQNEYSIQTQSGHDNSISLSIAKNGKKTDPVVLKDIVFEDNLSTQRHLGNDEAGSTIAYHLKASNQAKIFGLLFQNNPIATRIIRMRLADDKDGISQRELQLYIDVLNGTLPEKDEEDGHKKQDVNNGTSLRKLGLCIRETSFNNDPSITLVKYAPETFSPVNLPGQYDTTLVGEETAKRQRKRKPSHGKQRL